jgi:hypothetical protein
MRRRNLESRAKNARWTRSLTFNPLPAGEGKKKGLGFFSFGCVQGFGWWRRSYRDAL